MSSYDYGGGCACGLYAECRIECEYNEDNRLSSYKASRVLSDLLLLEIKEQKEVLARYENILKIKEQERK